METALIFVEHSCPRADLRCLILSVLPDERHAFQSDFQARNIRARQLVFSDKHIVASPTVQSSHVGVVGKHDHVESEEFTALLDTFKLKLERTAEPSPAILQSCLNYSIVARLAPQWNKAGKWLVQGRNFLSDSMQNRRLNAIEFSAACNQKEIYLNVTPCLTKLIVHRPTDAGVSSNVAFEFESGNRDKINGKAIYQQWCNVLPSGKKGQLVEISRRLDSGFGSFDELRSYWKNVYGYRLPDDPTDMTYYKIVFRAIGPDPLTYPSYCVLSAPVLPATDRKFESTPILNAFLQDLHAKMPFIFDVPLRVLVKQAPGGKKQLKPKATKADKSQLDNKQGRLTTWLQPPKQQQGSDQTVPPPDRQPSTSSVSSLDRFPSTSSDGRVVPRFGMPVKRPGLNANQPNKTPLAAPLAKQQRMNTYAPVVKNPAAKKGTAPKMPMKP